MAGEAGAAAGPPGRRSAASRRCAISERFWSPAASCAAGCGAGGLTAGISSDGAAIGRIAGMSRVGAARGAAATGSECPPFGFDNSCARPASVSAGARAGRRGAGGGAGTCGSTGRFQLTCSSSAAGRGRGAPGSGASGHDVVSSSGAARVSASVVPVPREAGTSRLTAWPRTILASIRMSVGPPIMIRCSTLSRRTITSLRRPSTAPASITARRGWRPRAAAPPRRLAPKRRKSQAAAPISANTTMNAIKNRTASGVSAPKRSNMNVPGLALRPDVPHPPAQACCLQS